MFIYCLWCGDEYESEKYYLTHKNNQDFTSLCNQIKTRILNNTSLDILDENNIFDYSIDSDLLDEIKQVLIKEYGFRELIINDTYHENGVDPYDFIDATMEGKQILGVNFWG